MNSLAEEIADNAFRKKEELIVGYYCGTRLKDMLTRGGLKRSEIDEIIDGILKWVSTSLAFTEEHRIIDWDQYRENSIDALSRYEGGIRERISKDHPRTPFDLVFYDNIMKDKEPCLRVSLTLWRKI